YDRLRVRGVNFAILHDSRRMESERKMIGYFNDVLRQIHFGNPALVRFLPYRETLCKKSFFEDYLLIGIFGLFPGIIQHIFVGENENPSSSLSESVIGRIYDPPFHHIVQIPENGEHHRKIPSPLFGRGFEETIDI